MAVDRIKTLRHLATLTIATLFVAAEDAYDWAAQLITTRDSRF